MSSSAAPQPTHSVPAKSSRSRLVRDDKPREPVRSRTRPHSPARPPDRTARRRTGPRESGPRRPANTMAGSSTGPSDMAASRNRSGGRRGRRRRPGRGRARPAPSGPSATGTTGRARGAAGRRRRGGRRSRLQGPGQGFGLDADMVGTRQQGDQLGVVAGLVGPGRARIRARRAARSSSGMPLGPGGGDAEHLVRTAGPELRGLDQHLAQPLVHGHRVPGRADAEAVDLARAAGARPCAAAG
jgi:hypothetical protein